MEQNFINSSVGNTFSRSEGSAKLTDMHFISPTTLFETVIPGYGPIHKLLLYRFGFDITILVSLGAMVWLTVRIGRSISATVYNLISANWMSEVSVSSNDEIFSHLIHFLAHLHQHQISRRLQVTTKTKSTWEMNEAADETSDTVVDSGGNIKWLNFSDQDAQSEPEFTPAVGHHNFWYNGTFFELNRRERTLFDNVGSGEAPTFAEEEIITIYCFGRSVDPIKVLLRVAKDYSCRHRERKTVIKRPAAKDMRRFNGPQCWTTIAERPCRPMDTIVLNNDSKMRILTDINEYLDRITRRWYSNRGIPYRRGYLLYGPPGTGKSSLSFALAGFFGLAIHVISLSDPTLTDQELSTLFLNLPVRCIVLLEDIDVAGLHRNIPESAGAKQKGELGTEDVAVDVIGFANALRKGVELSDQLQNKGITLSGLLNVIDGMSPYNIETVYLP